jgi:hypothetical protein
MALANLDDVLTADWWTPCSKRRGRASLPGTPEDLLRALDRALGIRAGGTLDGVIENTLRQPGKGLAAPCTEYETTFA